MKRRSERMTKLMDEYRPKAEAFKRKHPWCQCCKRKRSVHIHHTSGRHDGNLLDESTWLASCFSCHEKIHRNPEWAKSKGYLK